MNSVAFQGQHRYTQRRQNEETRQLPRGSYTQLMVNPTQLSDVEFTAWMDRLVEARRNRQENKPRPYSQFRKPFMQRRDKKEEVQRQQGLKHKLKPAAELNTEELMTHMRCKYVDIEEAVEMYNLEKGECRICLTRETIQPDAVTYDVGTTRRGMHCEQHPKEGYNFSNFQLEIHR